MGEYNKAIEELLNDFENLQLTKLVKQINMQSGAPTGSIGCNNQNNFETGETCNPFRNERDHKNKHADNFRKKQKFSIKRPFINDEFKPKSPLQLESVPTWGYIFNLDYVIDKRATIDN